MQPVVVLCVKGLVVVDLVVLLVVVIELDCGLNGAIVVEVKMLLMPLSKSNISFSSVVAGSLQ